MALIGFIGFYFRSFNYDELLVGYFLSRYYIISCRQSFLPKLLNESFCCDDLLAFLGKLIEIFGKNENAFKEF